jgi:hypothetical protein
VFHESPARRQFYLGQFGLKLTYLVLAPDRRAELVVGDGGHHEKPGLAGVESAV